MPRFITLRGQKRRGKIKGRSNLSRRGALTVTAVGSKHRLSGRCMDRADDRVDSNYEDREYLVAVLEVRVTQRRTTSIIAFFLSVVCFMPVMRKSQIRSHRHISNHLNHLTEPQISNAIFP